MKQRIVVFCLLLFCAASALSQEDNPFISFDIPSQNLLKFNRFLFNPTFSTVQEDNSYINLYHRNQWIEFEDSPEVYFASYSGRIGDRTGLGLGLYQQNLGVISNFGILANYAYGVRLSEKTNLTFGFNLSFFSSGLDTGDVFAGMPDPALQSIEDNSLLSFQPGFNLSFGNFDIGGYAENLVDFNLRTGESVTEFDEKTFSGHLMYTHRFKNNSGILENAKLRALARGRKPGDRDFNLSGSMILDLPKLGWVQGGYDDFFGVSAGIGFNLTKRLSLGYTIEKGLSNGIENLGTTHEITFAYSFQPNLTEDRVELDELELDELAKLENEVQEKDEVIAEKDDEIARIKKNLEDNNMILAELILKQDSLEKAVNDDIEKRFYHLIKNMKRDQGNNNNTLAQRSATNKKNNTNNNTARKNNSSKQTTKFNNTQPKVINASYGGNDNYEDFTLAAKANNIKYKRLNNLNTADGGYYVIANIYSKGSKGTFYRDAFLERLNRKGIDANYFLNPRNNLNYVYLQRYDSWQEAVQAVKSNFGGAYNDEMWILNVRNESSLQYANTNSGSKKAEKTTIIKKNDAGNAKSSTTLAKGDKKRISSPTPNASLNTSNKGRVVSAPKNAKKENIDRINSPSSNTLSNNSNTNNVTSNKNTRITTPERNNAVASKDADAIAEIDEKSEEEIKSLYSRNTAKRRKTAKKGRVINIDAVDEGYYIITNVFAVPSNASRFVKRLKEKGLDADFFINPDNNYRYVYIKKHNSWNSALATYYSNVDNTYFDDMWIMRVNTNYIL